MVIAVACLAAAGPDWLRYFRMSQWPVTPGRVTYADVRQEKDGDRFAYHPDVDVAYTVNGTAYKTRTLRADSLMTSADRGWADRIVGAYTQLRDVEVHYDPANPSVTRVEIAPQPAVLVLTVWGICALFGVFWLSRKTPAS